MAEKLMMMVTGTAKVFKKEKMAMHTNLLIFRPKKSNKNTL